MKRVKRIYITILVLLLCIILGISLIGCNNASAKCNRLSYIDSGISIVRIIRDNETGVEYIVCNDKGVTPRLNSDGSLYVDN